MNKMTFDGSLRLQTSLAVLLAVSLAACDRNADSPAPDTSATTQQQSSATQAVKDPFPSMTRAVNLSKAEQPVELRFELLATPQAAKPVQLKLNLLGLIDTSELQLQVSSASELAITTGAQTTYAALKQGESWAPTLELTSKSNGLFLLEVQLQATTESGVHTYKYAIPVAITTPESSSASVSSIAVGKT